LMEFMKKWEWADGCILFPSYHKEWLMSKLTLILLITAAVLLIPRKLSGNKREENARLKKRRRQKGKGVTKPYYRPLKPSIWWGQLIQVHKNIKYSVKKCNEQ
jgi:hypothetical protein